MEKEIKDNIKDFESVKEEKDKKEGKADENKKENKKVTKDTNVKEEKKEPSLEEKYAKLNDSYVRLLADFDNYKKRASKDKEASLVYSIGKFADPLFSIVDNLTRALDSNENKEDGFYKGVEMIYTQLIETLKNEGIEKINALGEKFDPLKHNAVMMDNNPENEDNEILEVLQDGYIYKEKVLRPSMVKVNKL